MSKNRKAKFRRRSERIALGMPTPVELRPFVRWFVRIPSQLKRSALAIRMSSGRSTLLDVPC